MQTDIFFVDTFTNKAFKGNPTAVCYFDILPDAAIMQDIAAELNLPVTAFIAPAEAGYDLRYFTAVTQIPACGHATLASAKIAMMRDKSDQIAFTTGQGLLINTVSTGEYILMSYPRFEWKESKAEKETLDSMAVDNFRSVAFSSELETLFIELESADELRNIQPDFPRLANSSNLIKEVVITSASDGPRYDYLLRSFCPWIGIDEDPVTGSVHSVLGPYWQQQLKKNNLRACQASARGGELLINAHDNRIEIGGQSVIVIKGQMKID